MNVYIETNFVLELTLLQAEVESCEQILELCEHRQAKLIIPAYALAEPNEKLRRSKQERDRAAQSITHTLNELSRSVPYQAQTTALQQEIINLLGRSGTEESERFSAVRARLIRTSEVIPLDETILSSAAVYERQFGLSPQDSLVFASILRHLQTNPAPSCFLTLNSKDFNDVDIQNMLMQHNCVIKFKFNHGYSYIQSQL